MTRALAALVLAASPALAHPDSGWLRSETAVLNEPAD